MVNNWEIEWNSSMIEHGRDLGTMEFIFAKGGNLSDMNYVMFDVQNNSWEPLIKAVAERENSHPDIIRKEAAQQQQPFMANRDQRAAQPFMGTAVTNPRQATQQFNTAQRMANLDEYFNAGKDATAGQAFRAGKYGTAAGKKMTDYGRNIMGAGRKAKDFAQNTAGPAMGRAMAGAKDMGGRALQAVKDSGMGERMSNFMGAAGRGISDLRHAPAAAKQSYRDNRARREDEDRRNTLEGGLGRGQRELDDAERRYVPGSQNFDTNMDRTRGSTSQGLARDFNVNPNTNDKGEATQSVEEAMRDEIKRIGDRRAQPKEGFLAGMKRRGEDRRAGNQAQEDGAAYAPSNMANTQQEEVPLPPGPSTDAEKTANADEVPEPGNTMPEIDYSQQLPREDPPKEAAAQPTKVEPETATATEMDPREEAFRRNFGRQDDAKGTGYAMGGKSGKELLGRGMESDIDLSNVDQQLTEQMIQSLGINDNQIGQAIMQRLRALPQFVKEQAAQGDAQAMERVEDEAEAAVEESSGGQGVKMPEINFGGDPNNQEFKLSSKKHEASWDSVLKGLNVR